MEPSQEIEAYDPNVPRSRPPVSHLWDSEIHSYVQYQDAADAPPPAAHPVPHAARTSVPRRATWAPTPAAASTYKTTTTTAAAAAAAASAAAAKTTVSSTKSQGLHARPRGRPPVGMAWDAYKGVWIDEDLYTPPDYLEDWQPQTQHASSSSSSSSSVSTLTSSKAAESQFRKDEGVILGLGGATGGNESNDNKQKRHSSGRPAGRAPQNCRWDASSNCYVPIKPPYGQLTLTPTSGGGQSPAAGSGGNCSSVVRAIAQQYDYAPLTVLPTGAR